MTERRLPPVTEVGMISLALIVAGGIYLSAHIPGDVPLALKDLDRAVAKGFKNLAAIDDDPDFERIRADPRFQKWLRNARAGS